MATKKDGAVVPAKQTDGRSKVPGTFLEPFSAFRRRSFRFAWPATKHTEPNWIDEYLLELGITPVIPSKEIEDRKARLVEFDREAYRDRNIVERLIGWLKECRRILTRFEKTATNYLGMLKMAFIQRYLKSATDF